MILSNHAIANRSIKLEVNIITEYRGIIDFTDDKDLKKNLNP